MSSDPMKSAPATGAPAPAPYAAGGLEAMPMPMPPGAPGAAPPVGATSDVMALNVLSQRPGLVIRQVTQVGEVLLQAAGVPFESANKYTVGSFPAGRVMVDKAAPTIPEAAVWIPTGEELERVEPLLFAQEDSSCLTRCLALMCGVGNLRPWKMHISLNGATGDAFVIERPFKCGGGCCCPLEMTMATGTGRLIGRVRQDFSPYLSKCCAVCCAATHYTDVEVPGAAPGQFNKLYTVRANLACCGARNNCCAATCCCPKKEMIVDILDNADNVVATIQRSYGASDKCCQAFCRSANYFQNWTIEFPADSTPDARALLLGSIFHLDYLAFEKQKMDDNK